MTENVKLIIVTAGVCLYSVHLYKQYIMRMVQLMVTSTKHQNLHLSHAAIMKPALTSIGGSS